MPQFDQFSFFNQIFWFFSLFIIFYLIISYFFLPNLNFNIKFRHKKLKKNINYNIFFLIEKNVNQKLLNHLYQFSFQHFKIFTTLNIKNKLKKTVLEITHFQNKINIFIINYYLF